MVDRIMAPPKVSNPNLTLEPVNMLLYMIKKDFADVIILKILGRYPRLYS